MCDILLQHYKEGYLLFTGSENTHKFLICQIFITTLQERTTGIEEYELFFNVNYYQLILSVSCNITKNRERMTSAKIHASKGL